MESEQPPSQQQPDLLTAKSIDKLIVPQVIDGEHQLQYSYSFWFTQRSRGSVSSAPSDYEDQIKHVAAFSSVEQFWSVYCHMAHPNDLPPHCDIHLFKMGIKPMWEDEANKEGGKWIVRLRKEISSRCWENLLLAMLGEQFIVGNEICGAVISIRPTEDIISIWNRTASDAYITGKIKDTITRVMQLPSQTIMEYKAHDASIKSAPLIFINSNNNYLALKILGISQVSGTQNYMAYNDDQLCHNIIFHFHSFVESFYTCHAKYIVCTIFCELISSQDHQNCYYLKLQFQLLLFEFPSVQARD